MFATKSIASCIGASLMVTASYAHAALGTWTQTSGLAISIDATAGNPWIAGTDNSAYQWNGSGWTKNLGASAGHVSQIAVSQSGTVFYLDANGHIFDLNGNQLGTGAGNEIIVRDNNTPCVRGTDNNFYCWNGSYWAYINGAGSQLATWYTGANGDGGGTEPACIDTNGNIEIFGSGGWGGLASQPSGRPISALTSMFAEVGESNIYEANGTNGSSWTRVGGPPNINTVRISSWYTIVQGLVECRLWALDVNHNIFYAPCS